MVKVGGSQKTKKNENRKTFINFAETRRNMRYASFDLGMDVPAVNQAWDEINSEDNNNIGITRTEIIISCDYEDNITKI